MRAVDLGRKCFGDFRAFRVQWGEFVVVTFQAGPFGVHVLISREVLNLIMILEGKEHPVGLTILGYGK